MTEVQEEGRKGAMQRYGEEHPRWTGLSIQRFLGRIRLGVFNEQQEG